VDKYLNNQSSNDEELDDNGVHEKKHQNFESFFTERARRSVRNLAVEHYYWWTKPEAQFLTSIRHLQRLKTLTIVTANADSWDPAPAETWKIDISIS